MADLAVTELKVGLAYPDQSETYPVTLLEDVTAGDLLYADNAGKVGIADANVANKQQARYMALQSGKTGQTITGVKRGFVEGFTITQNADIPLFLSDTAGKIADAAGTLTVNVGIIAVINNPPTHSKMVYLDLRWRGDYA
jgi:hypothetical protein